MVVFLLKWMSNIITVPTKEDQLTICRRIIVSIDSFIHLISSSPIQTLSTSLEDQLRSKSLTTPKGSIPECRRRVMNDFIPSLHPPFPMLNFCFLNVHTTHAEAARCSSSDCHREQHPHCCSRTTWQYRKVKETPDRDTRFRDFESCLDQVFHHIHCRSHLQRPYHFVCIAQKKTIKQGIGESLKGKS